MNEKRQEPPQSQIILQMLEELQTYAYTLRETTFDKLKSVMRDSEPNIEVARGGHELVELFEIMKNRIIAIEENLKDISDCIKRTEL